MIYITQEEADEIINDDGMCRADLLDYQNVTYHILEV